MAYTLWGEEARYPLPAPQQTATLQCVPQTDDLPRTKPQVLKSNDPHAPVQGHTGGGRPSDTGRPWAGWVTPCVGARKNSEAQTTMKTSARLHLSLYHLEEHQLLREGLRLRLWTQGDRKPGRLLIGRQACGRSVLAGHSRCGLAPDLWVGKAILVTRSPVRMPPCPQLLAPLWRGGRGN